jgi:hypothetical protein
MASPTRPSRRPTEAAPPRASPTPEELAVVPELALLAALQHVLELTTLTLVAIHPDLVGEPSYLRPLDPQALLADKLITLGLRLANVVTCYRTAAIAALTASDTDDLPF